MEAEGSDMLKSLLSSKGLAPYRKARHYWLRECDAGLLLVYFFSFAIGGQPFQYRVQEFKILEESEILEEQRFHASV